MNPALRSNVWTAAIAVMSLSACAPPTARDGSTSNEIVGGTTDSGDPSILLLESPDSYCTAEVISPHVLLTAAHCVKDETSWSVTVAGHRLRATEAHYNPAYNPDGDATADVGVILFAEPFALTPIRLNRTPLDPSLVGQTVRLVGYGSISARDNTAPKKRQTSSPLLGIDANSITVGDRNHAQCEGDSGGAALMDLGGGEILVGTDSMSANEINGGCAGDFDVRVDANLDFIDQYVSAVDPSFAPAPTMPATPAPTPGGCALQDGTNADEGSCGFDADGYGYLCSQGEWVFDSEGLCWD